MARIIPSEVDPKEFHASYGEKKIYEALKDLPDEYIVFYSLHWNKRNKKNYIEWGESDFTVFHPKRGIIVIEVKSGGIFHRDGMWTQKNTMSGKITKMKDPMVQAERSKHTFIDILEKSRGFREYRVETAVWFTSAQSFEEIGDMPPIYKEGNVLIAKDIENIKKGLERVFDYYRFKINSLYDKADMDNVIRKLSPEFSVVPTISNIIEEEEYYFNRMTEEQNRLIEYLDEQKVAAVQGGAGTGKTMLGIEKARRIHENEETKDDKVLFLCFNEFLHNFLKNRYREELPNVSFYSIDKLVKNHFKVKGEYASDEEILEFLNNYSEYSWDYKHIIIDEGQDFSSEQIEALYTIAELEEGCFYLFYDKNQLVYKLKEFRSIDRIDCRLVLTANCRNTRSIASSSNKILGIEKLKLKNDVIGEKPAFIVVKEKEELLGRIESEINKYTDENIGQKRIVLLTVKTEKKSSLKDVDRIGKYKIKKSLGEKGILFTTARKYKGLEADVVIIIDIDKNTFKDDTEKRVLYVGASRAKHFLSYIAVMNEEEKLDICEFLTGKRNRKVDELIGEKLEVRVVV